MEHIEKSIDVEAPLSAVYNQWTQFEEFPQFMEGVQEVRQLDDKRLHWRAKIAGKEKEWDAEIFEQSPDERIAWRSVSGAMNTGQVWFESLGSNQTRVSLKINYDPEGVVENMAGALGLVGARVHGDLTRFKKFIENRGSETGGWRGEIHGREVQSDSQRASTALGNSDQTRSQRIRSDLKVSAPVANENASGKMG